MFPRAFWHNLIMVAQRCHTHYTQTPVCCLFLPVVIWNYMIDFRATKFSWQLPNLPLKLQVFFQPNPERNGSDCTYTCTCSLTRDLGGLFGLDLRSQFEKLIQEFDLSPFGKKIPHSRTTIMFSFAAFCWILLYYRLSPLHVAWRGVM